MHIVNPVPLSLMKISVDLEKVRNKLFADSNAFLVAQIVLMTSY